jgi:hypothetical protein
MVTVTPLAGQEIRVVNGGNLKFPRKLKKRINRYFQEQKEKRPSLSNGSMYVIVHIEYNDEEIVVHVRRTTYSYKLARDARLKGVPFYITLNAPILVVGKDKDGVPHFILGENRGVVVIPGGMLNDQHMNASNPLLKNAIDELGEELYLFPRPEEFFFALIWKVKTSVHFVPVVFTELEQSVENFNAQWEKDGNPEMQKNLHVIPANADSINEYFDSLEKQGVKVYPRQRELLLAAVRYGII